MGRSVNTIALLLAIGACAAVPVMPADALASRSHPAVKSAHKLTRAHPKRHHTTVRASRRVAVRARCATGSGRTAPRAHRACRVVVRPAAKAPAKPAPALLPPPTATTPCQNTELTPEAGNMGLVRAAVLCLVNRERAAHGEQPLSVSARLEAAAEGHNAEMISENYFAHISPGGESPSDRIRETGYIPGPSVGFVIGENLAWGTLSLSTPRAIVAAWVASPPHLANILEAQYRDTGIGIVPAVPASLSGGQAGATYAQEFGTIVR